VQSSNGTTTAGLERCEKWLASQVSASLDRVDAALALEEAQTEACSDPTDSAPNPRHLDAIRDEMQLKLTPVKTLVEQVDANASHRFRELHNEYSSLSARVSSVESAVAQLAGAAPHLC